MVIQLLKQLCSWSATSIHSKTFVKVSCSFILCPMSIGKDTYSSVLHEENPLLVDRSPATSPRLGGHHT